MERKRRIKLSGPGNIGIVYASTRRLSRKRKKALKKMTNDEFMENLVLQWFKRNPL